VIFVDTSAWVALYSPHDQNHIAATTFLENSNDPLVTSDYILDEFLTVMKVKGYFLRSLPVAREILGNRLARLEYLLDADIAKSFFIFESFRDKGWSFTDCTSYVLMKRLEIQVALAFDLHFLQFGSVSVVP